MSELLDACTSVKQIVNCCLECLTATWILQHRMIARPFKKIGKIICASVDPDPIESSVDRKQSNSIHCESVIAPRRVREQQEILYVCRRCNMKESGMKPADNRTPAVMLNRI